MGTGFFQFIPMKISHKLCDRMDGTQFLSFPWLPANSLLCVILRYTLYLMFTIGYPELDKHKAYAFIFYFSHIFRPNSKTRMGTTRLKPLTDKAIGVKFAVESLALLLCTIPLIFLYLVHGGDYEPYSR